MYTHFLLVFRKQLYKESMLSGLGQPVEHSSLETRCLHERERSASYSGFGRVDIGLPGDCVWSGWSLNGAPCLWVFRV